MAKIEHFETRDALFAEATRAIARALRDAAEGEDRRASLACSGGSSPVPLYEALAGDSTIPWERVTVTLADERDAPDGDSARNDALVRKTLLRGAARGADFVPLVGTERLPSEALPLTAAVMGMGLDGHTASWFPGCQGLTEALEGGERDVVRTIPDPLPESGPFERLTLTRAALTNAKLLVLLVTGPEKRAVLDEAMRHGQVEALPVRALLHAREANLRVLYAD